jgi:hypothetical protein
MMWVASIEEICKPGSDEIRLVSTAMYRENICNQKPYSKEETFEKC